jgi:hypothetical protein
MVGVEFWPELGNYWLACVQNVPCQPKSCQLFGYPNGKLKTQLADHLEIIESSITRPLFGHATLGF